MRGKRGGGKDSSIVGAPPHAHKVGNGEQAEDKRKREDLAGLVEPIAAAVVRQVAFIKLHVRAGHERASKG